MISERCRDMKFVKRMKRVKMSATYVCHTLFILHILLALKNSDQLIGWFDHVILISSFLYKHAFHYIFLYMVYNIALSGDRSHRQ